MLQAGSKAQAKGSVNVDSADEKGSSQASETEHEDDDEGSKVSSDVMMV
jgi:hypothetical protein